MNLGKAFLRKELAALFERQEIESLIFLIFEKMKGYSRTQFLLSEAEILSPEDRQELERIAARLKNHEPIQYILGMTEFYGLPFHAVPGVLIPRPETEELVEWILQENQIPQPDILDMGTGSGCIAIALKKNLPGARVLACDISPLCIQTARENGRLNQTPIELVEYDILNNSGEENFPPLDIVVSNPPYIRESEKIFMERNVLEYEPELALFVSDREPLIFYSRIADFALIKLKKQGRLYFEINEAFGNQCVQMLQDKGFYEVQLKKDINGKDRMVRAVAFQGE